MPNPPETNHAYREPTTAGSIRVDKFLQQRLNKINQTIEEVRSSLDKIQEQYRADKNYKGRCHYQNQYIKLQGVSESVVNEVNRYSNTLHGNNTEKAAIESLKDIVHQEVFSIVLDKTKVCELTELFNVKENTVFKKFIVAAWLNSLITPNPPPPPTPKNPV